MLGKLVKRLAVALQVTHQRKPGSIAPGLSEQLIVEFTGQQLRYHYDCIRVQTEGGGLLIPLHAYPVMNEAQLPKRLDLGKVALGESTTQQLQLSCKLPLDFGFTVTVTKHNKAFTVSPMSGTVPANGSAAISITFMPASLATEELQLQVLLDEYNAKPMPVTVTGSAVAGLAKDRLVAAAMSSSSSSSTDAGVLQQAGRQAGQLASSAAGTICNRGGGTTRGGAGGGDAYTVQQKQTQLTSSSKAGSTLKRSTLLPALPNRQQPEVLQGDTCFPASLSTQHDINCVLTQQPGKLRSKDIKTAIASRKRELQSEQQELEAVLAAGTAAGLHPLDQPDIQPAIKEALFQLQLQQAEADAKHCTGLVGSQGQVLGQDPPSPDTVKQLKAARQAALDQHQRETQEAATHRLELELGEAGALHVLLEPQQQHNSVDSIDQHAQSAGPTSSNSSSIQQSYAGLEGFQPQWLLLEGNEWRKRVQVTQRFVNAVRVVMYRNRAHARLQKLKLLAVRLRGNRDHMAGAAVQEVMLESTLVIRPGLPPAQLLLPERVRLAQLPLYRPARFSVHSEVEPGQYGDFTMLQQQPYKAEFEYKLLGYAAEDYPGLIPYLPPCKDQPLMVGAAEEAAGELPSCLLPASLADAEVEAMPEALAASPFVQLEMGSRYTNDQVFVPLGPRWGCEPEALLQPRLYPYHDSAAKEAAGSCSIRALAAAPLRSHSWLPLQNPWQAGGAAEAPALLLGPDPALLEPDAPEDADKPQVAFKVPDIGPYIPEDAAAAADAHASSTPLARQQHQEETDVQKAQQLQAAVSGLKSSVDAYNQLLARPHRMAIRP
uniref:HYDIN/VesB/CFA65-like Ig-like domain-containing protein n=1 Tax=Tetradesmus obliquus TaxID=3088 RepID=A0A383WQ08_TETOB|eukprot:jgi/Sobl393_1/15969/SZX78796.1